MAKKPAKQKAKQKVPEKTGTSRMGAPSVFSSRDKPVQDYGEDLLVWGVTPFHYDRRKGNILVASTAAFVMLVYVLYQDLFWPLVALGLSLISFSSFIFPNHYRLTDRGIVYRNAATMYFKPWSAIRRYRTGEDGVYLLWHKTVRTRILGPGLFLYFGEVDRNQLHSILLKHLPPEFENAVQTDAASPLDDDTQKGG